MVFFSLLSYTTIFDAIALGCGLRVRFSVRCLDVRAGEEKRTLRKSAFCEVGVTEKRILGGWGHGKAHSGRLGSRVASQRVREAHKVRGREGLCAGGWRYVRARKSLVEPGPLEAAC